MSYIKKVVTNISKKNKIIKYFVRNTIKIKDTIRYKIFQIKNKTQKNLIVFDCYLGREYSCSPKAIYEEMLKQEQYKDFEFVWGYKNPKEKEKLNNMDKAIIVKYMSNKYLDYCSKATVIITNSILPEIITIKKDQKFLQCWHGTPLKRLGHDIEVEKGNALNTINDIKRRYDKASRKYTHMLSPSKYTTEKLTSCFDLNKNNPNINMIEKGYPRNDLMYTYTEEMIENIKKDLGIDKINKKILLYAPTFRDNQHDSGVGYVYKPEVDFDYLKENLGKDYIILYRAHYLVANSFDYEKYKDFILDVSKYEDITELYILSDMLITDYSSVFFDYSNLKRPIIFYMYDLDKYKSDIRGFYIGLEELPGNIVKEEERLVEEILKMNDNFVYDEKYMKFNDKFTYLDDGKSAARVVEELFKKGE